MSEKAVEKYDSAQDTREHIWKVQEFIGVIIGQLRHRAQYHDESKLKEPEKTLLDKYTPELAALTYGSDEYKSMLEKLKPALDHHYEANQHHPEHWKNGIEGMDLLDIIEMFCNWKAATLRHNDGDLKKSIDHNSERFNIPPTLAKIFHNTRERLGW